MFIASTCGEESDLEGDMDMTQEVNAAIELEVSRLFEEESEADNIGKQRSKELVVVSVSTQTEDPVVQPGSRRKTSATAIATIQCVVGLLEKINLVAGKTTMTILKK